MFSLIRNGELAILYLLVSSNVSCGPYLSPNTERINLITENKSKLIPLCHTIEHTDYFPDKKFWILPHPNDASTSSR